MKKILLLSAMAAMLGMSASAAIDNQKYEPMNGINIANQWVLDRIHTPDAWNKLEANNTRARTAVMLGDVIYVSRSEAKAVIIGNDTISQSVVYRFNAKDGSQLPDLDITLNGAPYGTFLGVNCIGADNFGHLWVMPYTSENTANVPFYALNAETGELTLLATLPKGDDIQRTDYGDVMGDIFCEQAGCHIMTVGTNASTVYRWDLFSDGSVEGGFEGDTYLTITDFYPESVTQWGYGPTVKMCLDPYADDPYAGELFYVDGFSSQPILYDITGTMIDNFEGVDPKLAQIEVGANGCAEFTLDDRSFLVYTVAQYSGWDEKLEMNRACQANICELGQDMEIETMSKYWTVPANGLGTTSDGGNRVACFSVAYGEEGGEECVTLFVFKCYNGMGVYKIGKGVKPSEIIDPVYPKGDVNGDKKVDVEDVNTLINILIGKDAAGKYAGRADVDEDEKVDVGDISALVNIMLGQ